jgi:stage II sporulation protein D
MALSPRRLLLLLCSLTALLLSFAGTAGAASVFVLRGGGDGHGIGMSQYGAYGYALHGADYRTILAHYYQGTSIGTTNPGQTVSVLLQSGSAAFSGATSASGAGGHPAKLQAGQTYTVAVIGGSLTLHPNSGKAITGLRAPLSVSGPGPLQLAGLGPYRGSLVFTPAGGNSVQTVDDVGLDDYVRGVVAAEMPSSWAPAALEAQAIAARTYAITTTVHGNGYDLYSDTRSQEYGGVNAETASTDAAVAATTGQIVTYAGNPAVTYFFASSGGHTESIQNVWVGATPEPWLKGVPDPYDGVAGNPYHSFTHQLSLSAAASKLGGLVKGALLGIQITHHGVSGRIEQAVVRGTRGSETVTGDQLAAAFGLPTTLISFTTITADLTPTGVAGLVFPSAAHSAILLQEQKSGSWRTVARATTQSGGGYRFTVMVAGRFRVTVGSLVGPVVAPATLSPGIAGLARQAAVRRTVRGLR